MNHLEYEWHAANEAGETRLVKLTSHETAVLLTTGDVEVERNYGRWTVEVETEAAITILEGILLSAEK